MLPAPHWGHDDAPVHSLQFGPESINPRTTCDGFYNPLPPVDKDKVSSATPLARGRPRHPMADVMS
jgi:hypothetical protein